MKNVACLNDTSSYKSFDSLWKLNVEYYKYMYTHIVFEISLISARGKYIIRHLPIDEESGFQGGQNCRQHWIKYMTLHCNRNNISMNCI